MQGLGPYRDLHHAAQQLQPDDEEALAVAPGPLGDGGDDAEDGHRLALHLLAELVEGDDGPFGVGGAEGHQGVVGQGHAQQLALPCRLFLGRGVIAAQRYARLLLDGAGGG